jgi:hypothetical protein
MKLRFPNTLIVCAAVAAMVVILLAAYVIPLLLALGMVMLSGSFGRLVIFLALGLGIPVLGPMDRTARHYQARAPQGLALGWIR